MIMTGTRLRVGRRHERHADLDVDRGMRELSTVPTSWRPTTRFPPIIPLARRDDGPCDVGHVRRHAPDDLALEVLDDLGPALVPPRVGRRDLRAALQRQRIGQVRIADSRALRRSSRRSAPRHRRCGRGAARECRAAAACCGDRRPSSTPPPRRSGTGPRAGATTLPRRAPMPRLPPLALRRALFRRSFS